jgi:hypothetical protein
MMGDRFVVDHDPIAHADRTRPGHRDAIAPGGSSEGDRRNGLTESRAIISSTVDANQKTKRAPVWFGARFSFGARFWF